MKVTVADCLELDAFAKAKVVAAKVNLTNEEIHLAAGCQQRR